MTLEVSYQAPASANEGARAWALTERTGWLHLGYRQGLSTSPGPSHSLDLYWTRIYSFRSSTISQVLSSLGLDNLRELEALARVLDGPGWLRLERTSHVLADAGQLAFELHDHKYVGSGLFEDDDYSFDLLVQVGDKSANFTSEVNEVKHDYDLKASELEALLSTLGFRTANDLLSGFKIQEAKDWRSLESSIFEIKRSAS